MVRYDEFLILHDLYKKYGNNEFKIDGKCIKSGHIKRWNSEGIIIRLRTERDKYCSYKVNVWKFSNKFILKIKIYKEKYSVE